MIIIKDKTTNSQLFIPRNNVTADYMTEEALKAYVDNILGEINNALENILY